MSSFNHYQGPRGRRFPFFPLAIVGMALIGGAVVRLLWNAILPELLGVREIRYWQAVGLLALCRLLFGTLGRGGPGSRMGPPKGGPGGPLREKWMQMTPEERSRFKEQWRERCRTRPDKQ